MSDIKERVLKYVNGLDEKGDLVDFKVYPDGRVNVLIDFGVKGTPKHKLHVDDLPEVKTTRKTTTSKK